ncbi:MAG: hypothetical protein H6810_07175 [Phycisphaeraceae bacterium]|nr:MAG: hypothetical protein H6810_07175 [Phycisphaeraceae bacterium]
MIRNAATLIVLLTALGSQVGCRSLGLGGGGRGEFVSDEQPTKLAPRFTTRLFDSSDSNTADMVLSDLDPTTLADRGGWGDTVGRVLQVRMFIRPYAGRTPIEPTACSVTMRYLVLAGGEYGIYAGGGFMLADGKPDGKEFGGRILNASMRLVSSSPGFKDLIGSGRMSLSFDVKRDTESVKRAVRNADFLAFGAQPAPDNPLLATGE